MDEPETPAEPADTQAAPDPASVIIATFENNHSAERTVASLGHAFGHQARKGDVAAYVVTRHSDGSFKLVQSRVLTAGGIGAAVAGFLIATKAGLLGLGAAFRGAKTVTKSAQQRQTHVPQTDQRLTEVLDEIGPRSAVLLVVCTDEQTEQLVAATAAERGSQSWHMSRAEFLAALDRMGDNYDWIRPVVAQPAAKDSPATPD